MVARPKPLLASVEKAVGKAMHQAFIRRCALFKKTSPSVFAALAVFISVFA